MASDPLQRSNVAKIITTSLGGTDENPGSRGPLKSATEAVAILAHASMIAVDFKLLGFDEDDRIGEDPEDPRFFLGHFVSLLVHSFSAKGFPFARNVSQR